MSTHVQFLWCNPSRYITDIWMAQNSHISPKKCLLKSINLQIVNYAKKDALYFRIHQLFFNLLYSIDGMIYFTMYQWYVLLTVKETTCDNENLQAKT